MDRLKVLHVITHLPMGGAQDNTLYTVELLDRRRYDVTLACSFEGELVARARQITDLHLVDIPNLCRPLKPIRDLKALADLVRLLRSGRFDIVHTHSSKPGVLARLAAKYCGVPVIFHTLHGFSFHDFMPYWKRKFLMILEKLLSHWTDLIITVSALNRQKVIQFGIAPAERVATVYSGIDLSVFNGSRDKSFRKEMGIADDVPLVGAVGRLSYQKDPLTLISAFDHVVKRIPDAQLVFIGEGELKDQMTKVIKSRKLDRQIHFAGSRKNVSGVYKSLDLFVMSSLYEGLGRSITEALGCGVPVVCTAVEGVPELVVNGQTGITVPPRDPEALAEGIIQSLLNLKSAQKTAARGQDVVKNNFGVEMMVEKIDRLYQQCCNDALSKDCNNEFTNCR